MTADLHPEGSVVTSPTHDLELIEHLDFEHTPQCEHSMHAAEPVEHGGPAYVLVRSECPGCSVIVVLYLCQTWWNVAIRGVPLLCECGESGTSHQFYTPLGWVE